MLPGSWSLNCLLSSCHMSAIVVHSCLQLSRVVRSMIHETNNCDCDLNYWQRGAVSACHTVMTRVRQFRHRYLSILRQACLKCLNMIVSSQILNCESAANMRFIHGGGRRMASLNIANIAAHRCHKWRALLMTLCTPSITSVTAARLGAGRGEVYLNKPQTRVPRPARPGLGWGRGRDTGRQKYHYPQLCSCCSASGSGQSRGSENVAVNTSCKG